MPKLIDKIDELSTQIFEERKEHTIPYYGVCWVLVGAPGDITQESQKVRLHQLIESFEALPGSVGRILSTSIGVFGMMSWWGADLDPILMSATVMSIGFSVDIPSHISYHFHLTRKETSCIRRRLESTISAVGFPIMQASVSTTLCVLSLFFVDLHMSQLFAKCMLLVVVIGMIHGLVVIPVMFNLMSALPRKVSYAVNSQQHRAISVEVNFP